MILDWFKSLFAGTDYEKVLNQTNKVRINGLVFEIRRLNPLDYLAGFKTMHQVYETYKRDQASVNSISDSPGQIEKIKSHYRDVFIAGVVKPQLGRKPDDPGLYIEILFKNWDTCERLYEKIIEYTYGKKKLKFFKSLVKN